VAPIDSGLDVLLVRAGRALERRRREVVAAHGLTTTGLAVLEALAGADRTSHRDLAAAVGVAPATLTPVLDALDRQDLVRRNRAVDDRRTVGISLGPRGREVLGAATADLAVRSRAWLPVAGEGIRGYLTELLARAEADDTPTGEEGRTLAGEGGRAPVSESGRTPSAREDARP
jgi:DNA-binding MarR family transcriptional regulator